MTSIRTMAAMPIMLFLAACERGLILATEPGALVPRTVDQDSSLPSLAVNGTLLHVRSIGSPNDPLIVVLHGGPGGDFRSLLSASAFATDGFQVVFYDQRGSGLSRREDRSQFEGAGALDLFIGDLDGVINHYAGDQSRQVFLLGHSWGAMLATAYIARNPGRISGAILAEPGGFTWPQAKEYVERAIRLRPLSEDFNDALFPDRLLAGRSEHEVLDYRASLFISYENAPDNPIGNKGPYPFWRSGAVANQGLAEHADHYGFDFTVGLEHFTTEVLFLFSEYSRAYGGEWAATVAAAYPDATIEMVRGTGHEMLYFGWADLYPKALSYLRRVQ